MKSLSQFYLNKECEIVVNEIEKCDAEIQKNLTILIETSFVQRTQQICQ